MIDLDRTGIADWALMNPRDSRDIVVTTAPDDAVVRFRSRVADRTVIVRFGGIPATSLAAETRGELHVEGYRLESPDVQTRSMCVVSAVPAVEIMVA